MTVNIANIVAKGATGGNKEAKLIFINIIKMSLIITVKTAKYISMDIQKYAMMNINDIKLLRLVLVRKFPTKILLPNSAIILMKTFNPVEEKGIACVHIL
ncbi:hypothetical protein KKF34_02475 [Myxococcota bacterium]|nr:hypothetical protein [Myxococcota bacterium]MBU1379507.1 hypothetical protein [Myxococcota bacterium]MBU1495728.1 hypothetical protein [Myxococcota bacterium]